MAVNSSAKCDLAAMAKTDEPNGLADAAETSRMVARSGPIIDLSSVGEPDRPHGKVNLSRQPTAAPSPPHSPPLLAPNQSHDLACAASEQLLRRISAEHLVMVASGAQRLADTSATEVGMPSRGHSPSNLSADDALVDMVAADAGQKLGLAACSQASSSEYYIPGKLQLQLPDLSSTMLAAGPTALSAETDLRSPLRFVSAHQLLSTKLACLDPMWLM